MPLAEYVDVIRQEFALASHFLSQDQAFYNLHIVSGISSSLVAIFTSFLKLSQAAVSLVYFSVLVCCKLIVLACPHLHVVGKAVVDFHRTQLTPRDLVVEFLCILIITLYLIFRKRIQRFWKRLMDQLAQKSRTAARLAPHVLFFTAALIISIFGRKFILPIASPSVFPMISILLPLFNTVQQLRRVQTNLYPSTLSLWIILASSFSIDAILGLIPFATGLISSIPMVRCLLLVVTVWIQASDVCSKMVFDAAAPLISYYAKRIPAVEMSKAIPMDTLATGLRFVGAKPSHISMLRALLEDTIALVITLLLLFSPSPLATIGVVLVALLLPAYKSSNVLLSPARASAPDVAEMKRWMEYWFCIGFLWLLRSYKIKLWPSIMMLCALWLQNSHFTGAHRLVNHLLLLFGPFLSWGDDMTLKDIVLATPAKVRSFMTPRPKTEPPKRRPLPVESENPSTPTTDRIVETVDTPLVDQPKRKVTQLPECEVASEEITKTPEVKNTEMISEITPSVKEIDSVSKSSGKKSSETSKRRVRKEKK